MNGMKAEIERILMEKLHPERLEVEDQSALHAGHEGARDGGGHFKVKIVAEAFRELPLLERHRLVYGLLEGSLGSSIHALALETRAPGEV